LAQRITMSVLPTGTDIGQSLFVYRVTIPLAPIRPFLWAASTARENGAFTSWHRVVGAEWTFSMPHVPFAGTPAARAQIGAGRSLDAPFAKKLRGYVNLVFLDP
jgi:hypothetical protein